MYGTISLFLFVLLNLAAVTDGPVVKLRLCYILFCWCISVARFQKILVLL